MEQQAQRDGLTGIANRRRFDQTLSEAWTGTRDRGEPLALLLIDIDHFKAYNDGYGHLAGDQCLRDVAIALTDAIEMPDALLARYGGEEFAIVLPNSNRDMAVALGERLRVAIEVRTLPHAYVGSGRITLSVGVAIADVRHDDAPASLIARADAALYVAKRQGRNRVAVAGA